MVAPYFEGNLTRSLVRIPNSRANRSLESVITDLSRVSSLAAMVPIPRTLPAALHQRQPPQVEFIIPEGKAAPSTASSSTIAANASPPSARPNIESTPVAPSVMRTAYTNINIPTTSNKRPVPQTSPGATSGTGGSPPTKRARAVQETQMNSSQASGFSGPLVVMPVYNIPLQQGVAVTYCSPQDLLQERNQLRNQNLALKQRLSLFQQLFRNKERLTSVVRTLGIQVQ
ncbi:uncharacterized protein LOC121869130 [Homarus americanus]|uniref:uncharacterized protein LOC121869130 n=1 Tax=Homarus americanus TaxID=6706 RepID=UPI001C496DC6|nr:uncharacterized protein LOC121869130 [Homarus americanus]XP_042226261.1 uncharacterized protein LOC121869130 [Homarus americanus]